MFDSNAPGARLAASLSDISRALQPGEQVQIRRLDAGGSTPITLKGPDPQEEPTAPWLIRLIGWLPLTAPDTRTTTLKVWTCWTPPRATMTCGSSATCAGRTGLAAVATRMSWYLGAMLTAIALAWLLIEVGLIRRVTALTRRAAAVSPYNVQPGHTAHAW